MAKSKFEYVKMFELADAMLPRCWPVVRVDGRSFHRFADVHKFHKPNDDRSLNLMSCAASHVMRGFKDVVLAYGQSDEYSFVFHKDCNLYNRRESKILSTVLSLFTSRFVFHWPEFFPTIPLQYPPSFDARIVLYPSRRILRDYLSWRQADCHINNLYNTVFWALVQQGGMTPAEAQLRLKGTLAGDKNEILFSQFGINYNNLPQLYRKGSVLIRRECSPVVDGGGDLSNENLAVSDVQGLNVDIIGEDFWKEHPQILGDDDNN
ncbi:probable tRNA(His) guanylyltransferase [Paramacrobiotus metropolitanus]|uniref:probable tRNA(His) guanylyltransferase n=1 Tax=Paramacrobiotus metropolitanus TaxID=2943436 RepID=UPI002445CCAA|nr:probable tRNA(His) guanylyltransferase [Paramacrobiotus metropolitanus]XP_055345821.1 probable tRNA(His) guanylyltransferase [Paramacrobiotus metropolitanus]